MKKHSRIFKFINLLLASTFVIMQTAPMVQALSQEDKDSIYKDTVWYKLGGETIPGESTGSSDSCVSPLLPTITDSVGVVSAINSYIANSFPSSPFKGMGQYIVASSQANGINPFLVVAIGQIESSMATARSGGVNEGPGFNAFGRSAASGQPSFSWSVSGGPGSWYKWSSWQDSVDDSTDPNTSSEESYLKSEYIDKGITDLESLVNKYLTGSTEGKVDGAGNKSTKYLDAATDIINKLISLSGVAITCEVSDPTAPGGPGGPLPDGTNAELAKKILSYRASGKYSCDNSGDCADLERVANNQSLQGVGNCLADTLNPKVLKAILYSIEGGGFKVGTYALCSDHPPCGNTRGHCGGNAVDFSSVNGVSIGTRSTQSRTNALALAKFLSGQQGALQPRQLITAGYGPNGNPANYDDAFLSLEIPNSAWYGGKCSGPYSSSGCVNIGHINHIHLGY